ncbi:MAG TPA: bifunctional 23S rRNA (guanine(2069)-N(7))-methyltransferase RlmK/23S rRNA (guanine(2445)-N(2))-methyltransferase RlmL [Pseudomonadales bacterium]|nr:bifunctional 23S rRNA (guanine(2069)-N(7))-methyltransferase RlmK/23S rRNA (guanine(2445)-N(2))-methyltransferase RlmL [Pseudomonadales bacterium]
MSDRERTGPALALFATHPLGFSDLVEQELVAFGATITSRAVAGVGFDGSLECAYRACLWSRVANRILLRLAEFAAPDADALYDGVQRIDWSDHVAPTGTLAVACTTARSQLAHSLFAAQRVKDAIVDQLRAATGTRPNVDVGAPDVRINVHLERDRAIVAIDLSGDSLHRRGYRRMQGVAPLKENLAAGLLLRAGWPRIAAAGGALLDPMCGSATFAIEALMMAADVAPNLARERFGFERWQSHVPARWTPLVAEARERRAAGLARAPLVRASDADARAVATASANVAAAGFSNYIGVERRALADIEPPAARGLLICNPPYGERLSDTAELPALFESLGKVLRGRFDGWRASVLAPDAELGFRTGLRVVKKNAARNGALDVVLLTFDVAADRALPPKPEPAARPARLDAHVGDFANRLRKNAKRLSRWAQRHDVSCYRIYDADLPDYAFAIDEYRTAEAMPQRWLHVQEYAPPAGVDADRAQLRRESALAVLPEALDVAAERIVVKTRARQRGAAQYEKLADARRFVRVDEGACRLWVNLHDRLDTGLFLDHRPLRQRIQRESAGKRFLNLFAYTGTATVHALRGGAAATTSVDLSNTYLEWALRNLKLNADDLAAHRLIRADCREWLADARERRERFDLILLDPPSFSNSKATATPLDVQRDHVELIRASVELLAPGGVLYFSTNLRTFRLDEGALGGLDCVNISADTVDEDFRRNPRVHQCWRIRGTTGAKPRDRTSTSAASGEERTHRRGF